ncbi:ATP phosphoribosyltransferase regulatory subunit, partial [Duncaniella sp.]|uniref:histidine--tRNA ligase n=1 Tax=Duncaniella sp. TaxID=2518496 RepID=UPI0023C76524
MAQKPSIPKGTRDFTPAEMARRNYIFDTIRTVFKLHGFQQIETPAMENLSTLMGKYGEEGDKLLFKILNSGDFLRGADPQLIQSAIAGDDSAKLAAKICEKGLRYDLTVPFARFVVMHRNDLSFPFKRFQIQPVWRADRPQKGRYREFYQCDADVIGSDSLINEIELLQLIDDVFSRLGIRITIKLNNRKVLAGIAELVGAPDKIVDITVAIDKIDKIGLDNVKAELGERGLSAEAIDRITPLITLSGSNAERLASLEEMLVSSETGLKGVSELREVMA